MSTRTFLYTKLLLIRSTYNYNEMEMEQVIFISKNSFKIKLRFHEFDKSKFNVFYFNIHISSRKCTHVGTIKL